MAARCLGPSAIGNALGNSIADGMQPGEQYSLTGMGAQFGEGRSLVRLGTGDDGSSLNNPPLDFNYEEPDRFEGEQFAGAAAAPKQLIKVGASQNWGNNQQLLYGGLEELSAALSPGEDPARLAELRSSGLAKIDAMRRAVQSDPQLQSELISRGLTFRGDVDRVAQLGAFGDPQTVQRIAVATAQAGGVGRASAAAIGAQMDELNCYTNAFVSRMSGDAGVLATAPGLYMNTLLGMRSHVDSTMLYVASMTDVQMAQLVSYASDVTSAGGLTRYKETEGVAAAWMGMQATAAGIERGTAALSITQTGLRNFAGSLLESFRGGSFDASQLGASLGKYGIPMLEPLYIVPPGSGSGRAVDFGALLTKLKGQAPEGMTDPHAHHILFKAGNGVRQKELVAEGQALLRSYNIDPIMGAENLVWAPNRIAGQHGFDALSNVVTQLKQVHDFVGTREAMVKKLEELGQLAAQRR